MDVFQLANDGKLVELKEIIKSNSGVCNEVDGNGRIALHWAASKGRHECAEVLLKAGSDANLPDDSGWTPLHIAASCGHRDIVGLLLAHGSLPDSQNNTGQVALHYAASKGHTDIVVDLLNHKASINIQDNYGATCLHRVASKGHLKIVKLLLATGLANHSLSNTSGDTPLHLACEEDRDEVAIALVQSGASVVAVNKEEQTPLDIANKSLRLTLHNLSQSINIDQ